MDPFLDDEESKGPGFDPLIYVRALWRRKWLFIIPSFLCLAMAAVVVKTMTPVFLSYGQVQIVLNNLDTGLLNDPSRRYGAPRNYDQLALTEMDMLLTSPEFLTDVVREFKLHEPILNRPPDPDIGSISEDEAIYMAINGIKSRIHLKRDGQHLFVIGLRHSDPETAYLQTRFMLDRFLEQFRSNQIAARTSTRDFLDRQLQVYVENLTSAEEALTEFQTGLATAALRDNPINALNLGQARANLKDWQERYDGQDATELAQLAQTARATLGSVPGISPYTEDSVVRSTVSEMEDLGLQVMLYDPAKVDRELDNRLGQLRVRLNTRIEEMVARNYPTLSFIDRNSVGQYVYFYIFRNGVKNVLDTLKTKIRDFGAFTARQPAQSSQLAELQGHVDRARELVETLEDEITTLNMNMEASRSEVGMQIRVRQQPRWPLYPIEPNKMKLAMMGGVLSLGIGLGLVFLAIFLDRTFNSIDDIEKTLGVKVIGTLPMIQDDHFESVHRLRILRWVTIVVGIIVVAAIGFLVIYPRLG